MAAGNPAPPQPSAPATATASPNATPTLSPCPHDVSFAGICASCGEETRDSDPAAPARLSVAYNGALSVSRGAGMAMDAANARRLLRDHKLSLVLDLDHTLIHATHDARAAAALHASEHPHQLPTTNPNHTHQLHKHHPSHNHHKSSPPQHHPPQKQTPQLHHHQHHKTFPLDDIQTLNLPTDPQTQIHHQSFSSSPPPSPSSPPVSEHCTAPPFQSPTAPQHHTGVHALHFPDSPVPMYVKMRPGLGRFLHQAALMFELHIYTMGNRPYAEKIASLIDPTRELFCGRVTSRDDFPEGMLNQKNLRRVFPCDDSMVLIVDDNEKVWTESPTQLFVQNLLVAKPYRFWTGLDEAYNRDAATGVLLQSNASSDHPNEDAKNLLTPELLNLVATWSKADERDRGHLDRLGEVLAQSHRRFFQRLQQLEDSRASSSPNGNHHHHHHHAHASPPLHIKDLLDEMRSNVLQGCCIAFTGVFATHLDPATTEPWLLAERLGATCQTHISPQVTHLLVDPRRGLLTSKITDAHAQGGVFIVHVGWLTESAVNWMRIDEQAFLIERQTHQDYPVFKRTIETLQQARRAIFVDTAADPGDGQNGDLARKKPRISDDEEFEQLLAEQLCD